MNSTQPHLPPGHPPVKPSRIGVLIVNLGTPEATDYWSMRRYLKQFLSDRRVIEVNPALWWFILNGIILMFRPTKSGHAYAEIWDKQRNESPLKTITRAQSDALGKVLKAGDTLKVDWAMRYGQPSIDDRLKAMKEDGCDRILVFPLYPQYSAATVASVMDNVGWAMQKMRWQPAIRVVPPYFDQKTYVNAIAQSLSAHPDGISWPAARVPRQGRSLSLPMPKNRPPRSAKNGHDLRSTTTGFPVPLRQSRMVETLCPRHGGSPARTRRQKPCHDFARLCFRLR
jgi:hypothetical protein